VADRPGKIIGIATAVDPSNVDDITGWAYGFCRQTPFAMLRDLNRRTPQSDDEIAAAVTKDLPDTTREASHKAGRRGLADQRRHGTGLVAPVKADDDAPRE
jgi:hypothetical protein